MSTTAKKTAYQKRGNPYLRGKSWTIVYYETDRRKGTSKRVRKGGFATKEEAQEALAIINAQLAQGNYCNPGRTTVEHYLAAWLDFHESEVSPNTYSGYKVHIDKHIVPTIGHLQLRDLNKADIKYMMDQMIRDGLSPRSAQYARSVLRKALNDAIGEGLLERNPAIYAKPPKQIPYTPTVLNQEEIHTLIAAALKSDISVEVLLAITVGMRRGEVCGLKFTDVDFRTGSVHIQRQVTNYQKGGKSWEARDLKTTSSNRIVYPPSYVLDSIRMRKAEYEAAKGSSQDDFLDEGYISFSPRGSFQSPQVLFRKFKALLKEANLPNIRFHDLRHSCATFLLESDTSLALISKLLGHSSLRITSDIYCHTTSEQKKLKSAFENMAGTIGL